MFSYKKYYITALCLSLLLTACTTSTRTITVKDENTGLNKLSYIIEKIEVKLMNEYKEIYDINEVIIGYNSDSFNPFDSKVIAVSFISNDKKFNTMYSHFSKKGIQTNLAQNEYMTFSDDAILGILAKEYGMKVIIIKNSDYKNIEELDYKNIDINFSAVEKYSLYKGFKSTIEHYKTLVTLK